MDKIDYIKIGLISPVKRDHMMKVEKTLVKNEFCTNEQLQEILGVTRPRLVQLTIQKLNECYGQSNHISPGRKHCLQHREKNLAFPESSYFDNSDKELLNDVLKLAAVFDGSIPLKSILNIYKPKVKELDGILNKFTSVMDVQLKGHEAKLIADLYKAIDSKIVVSFLYPQLEALYAPHKGTNRIYVSPYFLGRYNNKWFLIGAVTNLPRKQETRYPWSVFPLQRILKENKENMNIIFTDDGYKSIDIDRIKRYYKNVLGFYVPATRNEPFKEKLESLNIRLRFNDNIIHFLEENPIHSSQKIDKENHLLEINVVENPSLYKVLLSFGNDIEVLEPEHIRTEIHKRIAETLKLYK